MSHWCFLSSKWSRFTWSFRMDCTLYFLGQKSQENSIPPFCMWTFSLCLFREVFQANVWSQSTHLCLQSALLWIPRWLFKLLRLLKLFPQTMQGKTEPAVAASAVTEGWTANCLVPLWENDSSSTNSNVVVSMLVPGSSHSGSTGFCTMMIWDSLLCGAAGLM